MVLSAPRRRRTWRGVPDAGGQARLRVLPSRQPGPFFHLPTISDRGAERLHQLRPQRRIGSLRVLKQRILRGRIERTELLHFGHNRRQLRGGRRLFFVRGGFIGFLYGGRRRFHPPSAHDRTPWRTQQHCGQQQSQWEYAAAVHAGGWSVASDQWSEFRVERRMVRHNANLAQHCAARAGASESGIRGARSGEMLGKPVGNRKASR